MSKHEDFGSPDFDPLIEGTAGGRVLADCDTEVGLRGCAPNAQNMPHFAAHDSSVASTVYVVAKRIMFNEYMQYKISERGREGAD